MASSQRFTNRIKVSGRALGHRNFRIYFLGMLVSLVGTWMQTVAQSWLVYRLTGSSFLLGAVAFASQAPVFLLAPIGGVLADMRSRHRIILLTQTLSLVQAFVLAILTLSGHVTVAEILALSLMLGVVNAFDFPARQSFLIELAGKEDLMNAIALNSSMFNGARIVGPAIAGVVVALLGEGLCFLLNGISYVAVIIGLLALRLPQSDALRPSGSPAAHLKEGFQFVIRTRPIRAVLVVVASVSLFGISYSVLMPVFVREVLAGGPKLLGILLGAAGIGSFGGAIALATRTRVEGLERIVALSVGMFGATLIAFSFSRNSVLSAALLVPAGFALMLQMSGSNTLLQSMVPDIMRGRVMSFFSMCLMGIAPFGSLLAGGVSARVGAPLTVMGGGAICLALGLLLWVRKGGLLGHPVDLAPVVEEAYTDAV